MIIRPRLLATSGIIFASRLLGAAAMFGIQALIARYYGADQLGRYMVAIAAINILAMCLPLGFQTIAAYFAAAYKSQGHGSHLRRFMREAVLQTVAMSIAAWVVLQLLQNAGWLDLSFSTEALSAIVLAAAAIAIIALCGAILVALKHPLLGMAGDALLRPAMVGMGLMSVMTAASVGEPIELLLKRQGILFLLLAATILVISVVIVRRAPQSAESSAGERRRWWFYAAPWTIVALASDFFFDIDTLHLSRYLSYEDLAVFGIACRLFSLAAFAVGTVYAVAMPDIFEAEAAGRRDQFLLRVRSINRTAALLAVFIVVAAPLLTPWLLHLIGPEFEKASGPLSLLCIILLVRAVTGPAALMLSLERRPYVQLWAVALGLLALLAGNHVLVPIYGIYGACAAALIATTLWSVAMWWLAWRLTGIDVSIGLWPLSSARSAPASISSGQ